MEGIIGVAGQSVKSPITARETALDRISDHANTAGRIGDLIEGFLNRCRGNESGGEGANLRDVPTGHFAQIERLEKNLAHAEELARELSNIG